MQSDPIGPNKGESRVLRGGSAWSKAESLRSAFRYWNLPENPNVYDGFRCVRRPRRQP
jgi:formylglycine-generating enzyme required for sulfatase activity